jgi:hypothetical protein
LDLLACSTGGIETSKNRTKLGVQCGTSVIAAMAGRRTQWRGPVSGRPAICSARDSRHPKHGRVLALRVDFGLKAAHKGAMAKAKVTFKMQRIAEDNWQILAEYPGAEDRIIKGLTSKADVDDWLNGERRIDWLRSQGYAK